MPEYITKRDYEVSCAIIHPTNGVRSIERFVLGLLLRSDYLVCVCIDNLWAISVSRVLLRVYKTVVNRHPLNIGKG